MKSKQGHPVRQRGGPPTTPAGCTVGLGLVPITQRSSPFYGRALLPPLKPTGTARASMLPYIRYTELEVGTSIQCPFLASTSRPARTTTPPWLARTWCTNSMGTDHESTPTPTHAPLARCQQTSVKTRRTISDDDSTVLRLFLWTRIPFFNVKSAYRRRRDQMNTKPTARRMVGRDLVTHTRTFPDTREHDGGS
jgi:hypothetical protein